jgi:hypothetical protein
VTQLNLAEEEEEEEEVVVVVVGLVDEECMAKRAQAKKGLGPKEGTTRCRPRLFRANALLLPR